MLARTRKSFSFILLLAVLTFILPKELIHELSCHKDSVDHCISGGENDIVSNIHTHCDVLQLFISPFSLITQQTRFAATVFYFKFLIFNHKFPTADLFQVFEIRGPPAS
jgi:hypothetical protein